MNILIEGIDQAGKLLVGIHLDSRNQLSEDRPAHGKEDHNDYKCYDRFVHSVYPRPSHALQATVSRQPPPPQSLQTVTAAKPSSAMVVIAYGCSVVGSKSLSHSVQPVLFVLILVPFLGH